MPGTRQPNCNLEKICVTRFARRTILDEERKSERKREGGREKEREAREQKYIKKRGLIKVQGKQRQEREREREGEGRASVIDEKRKREGKGRRRLRTAADAEEIATPCGVYWNEDSECLFS